MALKREIELFDITVHHTIKQNTITLRGFLDDSIETRKHCLILKGIAKPARYVIEAVDVLLDMDGIVIWIEAVKEFLGDCELIYAPSDLGRVLKQDCRYRHKFSTFSKYF